MVQQCIAVFLKLNKLHEKLNEKKKDYVPLMKDPDSLMETERNSFSCLQRISYINSKLHD